MLMRHRTELYALVRACVRDHNDAEDILQEVSVAVIQSIDQLDDDSGFLPWAREICRRRILEHHRRNQRLMAVKPEVVAALLDAAETLNEREPVSLRKSALLQCLEELSERQRRMVAGRYREPRLSAESLAEEFEMTVQAFYSRIKRIKQLLRSCVQRQLASDA